MTTVALDWNAFMNGKVTPKVSTSVSVMKSASSVHSFLIVPQNVVPVIAASAKGSAFAHVFATLLSIADWTCLGVIVFAGATWMFGNRTKAIEVLLGGGIGYLIIRHSQDIRDWLREI
jgi:hypothetical protein